MNSKGNTILFNKDNYLGYLGIIIFFTIIAFNLSNLHDYSSYSDIYYYKSLYLQESGRDFGFIILINFFTQ